MVKKKGRQDTGVLHEAWLINKFEHPDTPNPITQSLYRCLVCHYICTLGYSVA